MTKEKMTRIAVYGTLKQGWGNHRLLERTPIYQGCVGIDRISGVGFPRVKLGNKEKLFVEVYDVNDRDLMSVDALEGYNPNRPASENRFYNRVKTTVTNLDTGLKEEVYIYEIVDEIPDIKITDICEEICSGQGSIYTWTGSYTNR